MKINTGYRLTLLRNYMKRLNLSAYFIPSHDNHFTKSNGDFDCRRGFISGFNGSSGDAIVTLDNAGLWTDSRYWLEADQVLDDNWTLFRVGLPTTPQPWDWLAANLPKNCSIGFNPYLLPHFEYCKMEKALNPRCNSSGRIFSPVNEDLVDLVWLDMSDSKNCSETYKLPRPIKPSKEITPLSVASVGLSWIEKLNKTREIMKSKSANVLVLTCLEDIAWLLNARGHDIQMPNLFYSFAIIDLSNIYLYLQKDSIKSSVEFINSLQGNQLHIKYYSQFLNDLQGICNANENGYVWMDVTASQGLISMVKPNQLLQLITPTSEMKAVKNNVELAKIRKLHLLDSLILCELYAWLDDIAQVQNDNDGPLNCSIVLPCGSLTDIPAKLTEISLATTLLRLRSLHEPFKNNSFPTISCADSNGAKVHYEPKPESDACFNINSMLLLDCGAQYDHIATTDVTRTMFLGKTPSIDQVQHFTAVLKAHVYLSSLPFPSGTVWSQLDVIARQVLWRFGLSYGHGTGHGVGAGLAVHESPAGYYPSNTLLLLGLPEPPIKENMTITIEPGYYKKNSYGIRLENVVEVIAKEKTSCPDHIKWLEFQPLTYVPFDRKLIDPQLLTKDELNWLNKYYQSIRAKILPLIPEENIASPSMNRTRCWITIQTEPFT